MQLPLHLLPRQRIDPQEQQVEPRLLLAQPVQLAQADVGLQPHRLVRQPVHRQPPEPPLPLLLLQLTVCPTVTPNRSASFRVSSSPSPGIGTTSPLAVTIRRSRASGVIPWSGMSRWRPPWVIRTGTVYMPSASFTPGMVFTSFRASAGTGRES